MVHNTAKKRQRDEPGHLADATNAKTVSAFMTDMMDVVDQD